MLHQLNSLLRRLLPPPVDSSSSAAVDRGADDAPASSAHSNEVKRLGEIIIFLCDLSSSPVAATRGPAATREAIIKATPLYVLSLVMVLLKTQNTSHDGEIIVFLIELQRSREGKRSPQNRGEKETVDSHPSQTLKRPKNRRRREEIRGNSKITL